MIKLENVTHHYQSKPTLQNLSVTILQGEFVYVVGPSGAGKSTFIKLIYNEEVVSSGDISVAGCDLTHLTTEEQANFRQQVGIIFQDFKLLERYTVWENLAYPLEVVGISEELIAQQVPTILDFVGLSGKGLNFPEELSGGEQQRVAIARALIRQPAVLIADEPTGNLDPNNSRMILKLLEKISATGTTVLMVTHDHSLAEQFPQRLLTIKNGQLVADSKGSDGKGD
ncbi:cell division ATP-binding protein FtsE [uncultured Vagococcus sp.]|uniref:cell division ATP-binding protein FtsE n=1 Tax=uncultured Vagococcus sp. TaxID=189676 RepID=UPI0028D13A38|nr:cell division ATP-binding protein FtsE [uncultured Vagococcus sp.]